MLSFTPDAINRWLLKEPGGRRALEAGLGFDATPNALLALERLAEALNGANRERLQVILTNPAFLTLLRTLATHLGMGRRYRLMGWLAETDSSPEGRVSSSFLDDAAYPVGSGEALRNDIVRQYRFSLLETIFDETRIARVLASCRGEGA